MSYNLVSFFGFQWAKHPRSIIEPFVLLLSPYAPHMAEEIWSRLGHSNSLAYEPFPQVYLFLCLTSGTCNANYHQLIFRLYEFDLTLCGL